MTSQSAHVACLSRKERKQLKDGPVKSCVDGQVLCSAAPKAADKILIAFHNQTSDQKIKKWVHLCWFIVIILLRCPGGGAVKGKKVDESATSSSDSSDVDLSRVCQGLDYHVNGEDPPLKEDNEYPDWLWQIAEPVKSHKELPEGSKEYWRRLNKYSTRNTNMIRKQSGL